MPSTKRRQQYTFRNTTTREDFVVGEASGANESNTAPDEDRAPSDTLFPNHEGAKGHDDVAGRRRSECNDPVVHGSERTGSHDLDGHHATDASRSQEKYSTRRTLGRWGSDRNALRSRASEAGPGEGNLIRYLSGKIQIGPLRRRNILRHGGQRFTVSIAEWRPCSKVPSFLIKPSKGPRICSPPRALSLPRFPTAEERENERTAEATSEKRVSFTCFDSCPIDCSVAFPGSGKRREGESPFCFFDEDVYVMSS
ncbi:hypothetical protein BHE74_00010677 [Ensete ventricosum]|nr:hypothetical protein BHE74_00010677 [Ensete ventricosum]